MTSLQGGRERLWISAVKGPELGKQCMSILLTASRGSRSASEISRPLCDSKREGDGPARRVNLERAEYQTWAMVRKVGGKKYVAQVGQIEGGVKGSVAVQFYVPIMLVSRLPPLVQATVGETTTSQGFCQAESVSQDTRSLWQGPTTSAASPPQTTDRSARTENTSPLRELSSD
jgi:hypothetical protein